MGDLTYEPYDTILQQFITLTFVDFPSFQAST